MNTDYIRDLIIPLQKPPLLTRGEFVAKYMPQYAGAYRPDYRIRTYVDKHGKIRVPHITKGNIQAQNTKRQQRVSDAYAHYVSMWQSV